MNVITKLREGVRLSSDKLRVQAAERHNPFKPLSAKGHLQHFYVDPHCFWWGKNERTLLAQTLATVKVQDQYGARQELVNAGSHNYAGFYQMTPDAEELQRLCLEKLTFADVRTVPSLEKAMTQAVCKHFSSDFCCTSSSGFGMNLLALPAILDETWLVLVDEKSHSSMYTGAFLAKTGYIKKFRHNDMTQLKSMLEELGPKYKNSLVVVEGFYSMDGTVPALPALQGLKQQYGFVLYCDEAHSFLSIGSYGRGCLEMWNDEHPDAPLPSDLIDLRTATLSKVVGGLGGVVFGAARFEKAIRARFDYLYERGEESVSTSTLVQTLYVLGQPTRLRRQLHHLRDITVFCRKELQRFGVHVYGNAATPILPVHAGRPSMSAKLSYRLRQLGLLATPVAIPAVKFWESRVRVTLSADFTDDHVNTLLDCIIKASQNIGITSKVNLPRRRYVYPEDMDDTSDKEDEEHTACVTRSYELIRQDAASQGNCDSHSKRTFQRNCGQAVIEAGHESRARYGLGSSGSRWLTGTFPPHLEVENMLAKITRQETAMTFANAEIGLATTISALCRPLLGYKKHFLLIKSQCHEAVRDGLRIASKKEKPEVLEYRDMEELLVIVGQYASSGTYFTLCMDTVINGKLVSFDKFASQLHQKKGRAGITLLLNDSDGFGQCGPRRLSISGSIIDMWVASKTPNTQILVYGSFYRAFGLSGGFLAGSNVLIQELRYTARGYMFSTSPQPFVMDMVKKVLENRVGMTEMEGF